MKHTEGPWYIDERHQTTVVLLFADVYHDVADCDMYFSGDEARANAILIAQAPAMELALQMIAAGIARIEKSKTVTEFCFDGMRYVMNGNWTSAIDAIGWHRAQRALKALGELESA